MTTEKPEPHPEAVKLIKNIVSIYGFKPGTHDTGPDCKACREQALMVTALLKSELERETAGLREERDKAREAAMLLHPESGVTIDFTALVEQIKQDALAASKAEADRLQADLLLANDEMKQMRIDADRLRNSLKLVADALRNYDASYSMRSALHTALAALEPKP